MKKIPEFILGIPVSLMIVFAGSVMTAYVLAESDSEKQESGVNWHPQSGKGAVDGASAHLTRNSNGVDFSFHSRELKPGHVYTLWFVVVNTPEKCAAYPKPCTGADDVIGNTDAVQADVTYANGIVADKDGEATLSGQMSAGDLPNSWFGNGFGDAFKAEIHLVVNDHGPEIPEIADEMMHSYRGGCTDGSLPPSFPDKAKTNGAPGPNTCRLYQTAIFQPTK